MSITEEQKLENDKKLTQLLKEKSSNRTFAYIDKQLTLIFKLGDAEGSLQYKAGMTMNDMTPEIQELFKNYSHCEYCGENNINLLTQECNCPNCERKHLICFHCESF